MKTKSKQTPESKREIPAITPEMEGLLTRLAEILYDIASTRKVTPTQAPVPKLTMSISEAAQALGISRGLMYQRVRQGQIPGVIKIGRKFLVSRTALMRYIDPNFQTEPSISTGSQKIW